MPQYVGITGLNRSSGLRVPAYTELDTPADNFAATVNDGVSTLVADEYFYTVTALGSSGEGLPATEDSATVAEVTTNETQTITVDGTGGTFTLTFDSETTAAIDWDATSAEIEAELEGLASVGAGNVSVTGDGPHVVEFIGDLAHTDVGAITTDDALVTGNEWQAITITATGGTYTITGTAGQSEAVAWDADAATIRTALGNAITEGITAIQSETHAGGVYTFSYVGALANTDVAEPTLQTGSLTGGTATLSTVRNGVAAPGVTITPGDTGDEGQVVDLAWDAVVGATGYRVYKGTETGTYTEYFEVAATSYTDDGTAGEPGTPPAESSAVISAGDAKVVPGVVTIVDVDDIQTRKALNSRKAFGQFVVVALNNDVGGVDLPANT